jgi:hypothetical protein
MQRFFRFLIRDGGIVAVAAVVFSVATGVHALAGTIH